MPRLARAAVTCAAAALALAACTQGSSAPAVSGDPPGAHGRSSSGPHPVATGTRIVTGPTTSGQEASCPFVETKFVHKTMGMRLGRLTVQHSAGRVVGCRFYALQGGPLHRSEHLPGPEQPAVEIVTSRYSTATAAHNAFVRLATRNTDAQQAQLSDGVVGACFQNDFYAHDHGQDWACAANKAGTELVVRSVDTTGTFNTIAVTKAVLGAL